MKTNVLYYGDNLEILRKHIPDNSIDLIYLDPPFSSKKDYNIIFKEPTGKQPEAQIKAFKDTWHWEAAEDTFQDLIHNGPPKIARLIDSLCSEEHGMLGRNDVTAYLVMMTIRLLELRRVLKDTGSLYLHCDPTAGHYLKLVLDQIFGTHNFQNEIIWYYRGAGVSPKRFGRRHDTIFLYTKSSTWTFNAEDVREPYAEATVERFKHYIGNIRNGRNYGVQKLHPAGKHPDDVWGISIVAPSAKERLGYPTQKPEALLERIIKASSNEGDIVLDPFCGCGTALVGAQKLNRRWIGIDITYLAIEVMEKRLMDSFPGIQFDIEGIPEDIAGAKALAHKSRTQFELWALGLVKAKPLGQGRRNGGIDGIIAFQEDAKKIARVAVQVKSGAVNPGQIRDLEGVLATKNYAMGIFLTLNPPTQGMREEAIKAGHYRHPLFDIDYPKIQILTIEEHFQGKTIDMPPTTREFLPKAPRISKPQGEQIALEEQSL